MFLIKKWSYASLLLISSLWTATASHHHIARTSHAHVARDLTSFITTEKARALSGILANIGSNGALAQEAKAGVVVASPSTVNPDYVYTWTRDSALTLRALTDEFIDGNSSLQSHITDYITAQANLQTLSNPSGDFSSGAGLGEPKFYVNLTAFEDAWGRPQRDGPALRAIALMEYIGWLLKNNQGDIAKNVVWPVVLNDVTYVAQYWNLTTFDLWEEVSGSSFFTTANQHRALAQATQVATALNTSCTACESQAPEILCFLNSAYWNGNYIDANINITANRSGLDSNTVLASISVFDINAPCSSETFQPCSSYSLANFKALTDSFRPIYAINSAAIGVGSAVAVGRYPEDIYYGGNPWYLATLACAEFLYDAVAQWNTQKSLTVDSTSISFFQDLDSSVKAGTYASSSSEFTTLTTAATSYADAFVSVVETYVPTNGSLSEQFNRTTGYPLSAYDLTWSFASFVTMSQRRAGTFPLSWGAANIQSAPSKCIGGGVEGTYTVAQAAESGQASSTATGTSGGSASGTGTGPASATTTKSGAVATFALDYLYLLVLGVFAAVLSF